MSAHHFLVDPSIPSAPSAPIVAQNTSTSAEINEMQSRSLPIVVQDTLPRVMPNNAAVSALSTQSATIAAQDSMPTRAASNAVQRVFTPTATDAVIARRRHPLTRGSYNAALSASIQPAPIAAQDTPTRAETNEVRSVSLPNLQIDAQSAPPRVMPNAEPIASAPPGPIAPQSEEDVEEEDDEAGSDDDAVDHDGDPDGDDEGNGTANDEEGEEDDDASAANDNGRTMWTAAETVTFINVLAVHYPRLRRRQSRPEDGPVHVWDDIWRDYKELAAIEHPGRSERSRNTIKNKWQSLKKAYDRALRRRNATGAGGTIPGRQFSHFDAIHAMVIDDPSITPITILESGAPNLQTFPAAEARRAAADAVASASNDVPTTEETTATHLNNSRNASNGRDTALNRDRSSTNAIATAQGVVSVLGRARDSDEGEEIDEELQRPPRQRARTVARSVENLVTLYEEGQRNFQARMERREAAAQQRHNENYAQNQELLDLFRMYLNTSVGNVRSRSTTPRLTNNAIDEEDEI
ncbi:hypothetical protein BC940DRAFT_332805 [Gongronella butleri]|nr:hypothetical protein BC940DRAFT_332805 [Gongronella butleri]